MSTIDKIIILVDGKYGAPMGRHSTGKRPAGKKVFDCRVALDTGGYDKGGAYWGTPDNLRVSYTKDLSFVEFYRK